MRHRLCIQPRCWTCLIAASTMGYPVCPFAQASKCFLSYDHSMLEYSGLKGLFILAHAVLAQPHGLVAYIRPRLGHNSPDIGPVD